MYEISSTSVAAASREIFRSATITFPRPDGGPCYDTPRRHSVLLLRCPPRSHLCIRSVHVEEAGQELPLDPFYLNAGQSLLVDHAYCASHLPIDDAPVNLTDAFDSAPAAAIISSPVAFCWGMEPCWPPLDVRPGFITLPRGHHLYLVELVRCSSALTMLEGGLPDHVRYLRVRVNAFSVPEEHTVLPVQLGQAISPSFSDVNPP